jgi:hypothetical protein
MGRAAARAVMNIVLTVAITVRMKSSSCISASGFP